MTFPVRNYRRLQWLALPITAMVLALAIGFVVKQKQLKRLELLARQKGSGNIDLVGGSTLSGERLSESLLTDSILSIVQSYYVDPERVDNRRLLLTALDSLGASPRIKTGSSPGSVWVEIDGDRKIFPLKENPRYQDVLDVYATVARMLDDAKVVLNGGEAPEKNASGSVALLNSMLAELDAHSALLSPDAYKELRQGTEGAFGGLGVLVGIRDNMLTVIKPLPRSPAQRAGIRKHDRILGIDGMFTYGYSLDDLVEYMRGDPGTDVQLSLLRDGANAPSEMTLKREVIQVDSVTAEEIDKKGLKVLHLTIENFASRTSREVLNAIKKYKGKNGGVMNGLVLDLRSNPGGLLDQAVQVSDLFLQSGVIVTTKGRREEIENAGSGFDEVDFPVAVLVDGDSASASEIVAGALQDHGRAVVIGQPSFGKGSVQTIFELPGERALKLTIARYYTPGGYSIQNVGIIPDIWLQPVAKTDINENLFGPYRYKNERFLHHHLNFEDTAQADAKVRLPSRKAYYLADHVGEEDSGEPRVQDQEMEMALKVIAKIKDTYGNKLPAGTSRASHWLGLAGPVIAATSDKLDHEAAVWLKKRYGLDWTAALAPVSNPDLKLSLVDDAAKEITTGETLHVPWTIENKEAVTIERASIYVRSELPGFETKEILIGVIPANGTKKGTFELPIPPGFDTGMLTMHFGVAVDAWPVRQANAEFTTEVLPRAVADIVATVSLDDAGTPQLLEPKEKAKLKIDLKNIGQVAATEVKLRVVNLSGSQVDVMSETLAVGDIDPNDHQTAYVSVTGGKTLYTSDLSFGVFVESPDLRSPLRQRNVVKGRPNGQLPQVSKAMSH